MQSFKNALFQFGGDICLWLMQSQSKGNSRRQFLAKSNFSQKTHKKITKNLFLVLQTKTRCRWNQEDKIYLNMNFLGASWCISIFHWNTWLEKKINIRAQFEIRFHHQKERSHSIYFLESFYTNLYNIPTKLICVWFYSSIWVVF